MLARTKSIKHENGNSVFGWFMVLTNQHGFLSCVKTVCLFNSLVGHCQRLMILKESHNFKDSKGLAD